jgi:MSHA biogenesis protein MshO
MRPSRPERAAGVTLVELVVAMVLVGIIVAATVYFIYPVTQSVDLATRAELTDIADNALQRIGRDARLALPNSIRTDTSGATIFVEFLPIRTAGRYRADAGGAGGTADCPPDGVAAPAADQLSFDGVVDTCFKTIGTVVDVGTITTDDFLVFNNHGPGFSGQNAYETSGTLNRRKLSALPGTAEATRVRFAFTSVVALERALHDSAGKRFFVVIGSNVTALPSPVTYECNPTAGTLIRRWGYTMVETPTSPPTFTGGTSAQIARDVTACNFDYAPNVAPQIGLLTLRLTLQRAVSNTTETVSLYHAVHVSNVP